MSYITDSTDIEKAIMEQFGKLPEVKMPRDYYLEDTYDDQEGLYTIEAYPYIEYEPD